MRKLALFLCLSAVASGQFPNFWKRTNGTLSPKSSSDSVAISATVLGPKTIGAGANQLPAAAAGNSGWVTVVTDAANGGDCTVGAGTSAALCRSNGSAWVPLGGGGSGGYARAAWGFCASVNCQAGDVVNAPYIVAVSHTISKCYAAADTGPTGADLIVDVTKAGVSIFGAGTKLVISAGSTTGSQTAIANASVVEGDLLKATITQVGSTIPGKDLAVACKLQ